MVVFVGFVVRGGGGGEGLFCGCFLWDFQYLHSVNIS